MKLNLFFKAGAFWAGVIAVAAWTGCSTSTTAGTCTTNADCASGDYCDTATGACTSVAACTSDAECPSGDTCDTATGTCIAASGCTSDAECTAPQICDTTTGACVAPAGCMSDADCTAPDTCDTTTGMCVAGTSCQQCACTDLMSMGGCADLCKMGTNGTSTPNFCDGVPALSQCTACLMANCPSADPTSPSTCN